MHYAVWRNDLRVNELPSAVIHGTCRYSPRPGLGHSRDKQNKMGVPFSPPPAAVSCFLHLILKNCPTIKKCTKIKIKNAPNKIMPNICKVAQNQSKSIQIQFKSNSIQIQFNSMQFKFNNSIQIQQFNSNSI